MRMGNILVSIGLIGLAHHAPSQQSSRAPNLTGRVPILMYHIVGDHDGKYWRSREGFRHDLQLLYDRGYRPIGLAEFVDGTFELPRGIAPVVFTFDDASPSQFSYVERNGKLEIDSLSALGIWLAFGKSHPGWTNRGAFCMLPAAKAGHAFFGDHGIEGQKTEWRFPKLKQLVDLGFELCDHTLWHADLRKYPEAVVQEQIARGALAIDSAVPGYRVRSLALPYGAWPKNRALTQAGSWRNPKGGQIVSYKFDVVLEATGGPAPSPKSPSFDPHRLPRVEILGNYLATLLARLEREQTGFVSDGKPLKVAR